MVGIHLRLDQTSSLNNTEQILYSRLREAARDLSWDIASRLRIPVKVPVVEVL